MVHNGGNPDEDVWSRMGPHDEFVELCAVSTSGELTEDEKTKLQKHLAICPECREALKEFQATAEISRPLFAAETSKDLPVNLDVWSVDQAEAAFRERLARESDEAGSDSSRQDEMRLRASIGRNGKPPVSEHWNHVWLPFAAAILLAATLGIYVYRVGVKHGAEDVRTSPPVKETPVAVLQQQMSDAGHDRQLLVVQMAERDKVIEGLRHQVEQDSAELNKIKEAQAALQTASKTTEKEKQQLAASQAAVTQKLETTEASLQKTKKELESLQAQRSQDDAGAKALQAKVGELNQLLRDQEATIDQQQELLAHDRDIRELMGARDLYIAEVFDVAKTGATQKPYGRVFFTKGKSLIFYAYDLDRQAGFKNASTFQAWGQHGQDREQALNLGVFFEDSASKKRWVLKFDDPQKLDQIDAVFVTVEPNGGSHKPSGKPLLFAYLKVHPNHP
jgi:flagellar motor protein MotB